MKFNLLIITLLIVQCFSFAAKAVEVENLYIGKILVNDRTQKTRVKAHRWAIEQVITKVTGNREILENAEIKRQVRLHTANYIKSFTFTTDEHNRTFLVDEFDQQKIDKLLRDVGASIWGQRRPQTLIWFVIEEGLSRQIVDNVSAPQISELLLQASDNRGLPLTLPDRAAISSVHSSDIWAKFDHIMSKVSAGHDVEHYVMARMYYESIGQQETWVLDFQLMDGRDILLKQEFRGEQFTVVREMVDSLADYFASQYSIRSEVLGQKSLKMTIEGVNNIVDLTTIEGYLKNLPPVSRLELESIQNNNAQFVLHLSGQGLDVIKALDLLGEFVRLEDKVVETTEKLSVAEQLEQLRESYLQQEQLVEKMASQEVNSLRYRWVP